MMRTVERAQHRWREILPQLGIPAHFLRNKQGPCPICGGKTRFRFDDLDGNGTWYCNHGLAGAGLHLVQKVNGWDYKSACQKIDEIIGTEWTPKTASLGKREKSAASKLSAIRRLLREAGDTDVLDAYLRKRGLRARSVILRGHRQCPYYDETGHLVGRFPAVIVPILGPDGSLQSAQRIYDADITPRKKTLPAVDTINGGAARLHRSNGVLGVAEGTETALAAHQLFQVPVWACLSDGGIKTFQPPEDITKLVIFGDNDASFIGQAAAYDLAKRVGKALTVKVRIPPMPDSDWLDVLNGQRQ